MSSLIVLIVIVFFIALVVEIITREKTVSTKNQVKTIKPSIHTSFHFNVEEDITPNYTVSKERKVHNEEYQTVTSIPTRNLYITAHEALNLSLFEKNLTEEKIHHAYEKLLDMHLNHIQLVQLTEFNIEEKKNARDYLLNWIQDQK